MAGDPVSSWVIGVDGGGTRTRCLVGDLDGKIIARAERGTSNPFYGDDAALKALLEGVIWDALQQAAGTDGRGRVAALWAGIAGVAESEKAVHVRDWLRHLLHHPPQGEWPQGVAMPGPQVPVGVSSDFLNALVAGAGQRQGVVVISGTGSVMYGETRDGRTARAGGFGPFLDDEGSGYQIGHQALRALVQAFDGRGPHTLLTGQVLEFWQAESPRRLFRGLLSHPPRPSDIARLVPVVAQAAGQGDAIAGALLVDAGRRLAAGVGAVLRQLHLEESPVSVVLSGGVLQHVPAVRQSLEEALALAYPQAKPVRLQDPPAMGAVRLALELLGAISL